MLRFVVSPDPRAEAPPARDNIEPVAALLLEAEPRHQRARKARRGRVGSASSRPRGTGRSDRAQLERLCRYVTRPPLAQDRLQLRSDGRLELTLKNIWRDALFDAAASDGAAVRAMIFEPHDLLATSRGRSATSEFSFVEVLRRSFGGTPRSAAKLFPSPRAIRSSAGRHPPLAISSSCYRVTTAALLLRSDGRGF